MNQADVEQFVASLPNVQHTENFGYQFYFVGDDHRLPFVTIANTDNEYDNVSNLNRDGVFRINIGVSKETCTNLTGHIDGNDVDYSVLNTFLPHPDYAVQSWVCILNPTGGNIEQTKRLIEEAHAIATTRYQRQQPGSRRLHWDACYNVRDLGGLPAAGGKQTRRGAVVRADLLGRLTEAGEQSLQEYGVSTIIDLRTPEEVAAEPSAFTAGAPGAPTYLNLPLDRKRPHVEALLQQPLSHAEAYNIFLDHYPDAVADVMRAIIHAAPGAVVFHCHSGKDRTGIIAALLLRLAGVPKPIVADDYAHSRDCLWPLYEQVVAQAGGPEHVDPWLEPRCPPETMHKMLDHIETRYGSVRDYLTNAAGLSVEEIKRLQQRLLPDG